MSTEETIDLTTDEDSRGGLNKGNKRKRDTISVREAAENESEAQKQRRLEEEAATSRIMSFAANVNKKRGLAPALGVPHSKTDVSTLETKLPVPTSRSLTDNEVVIIDSDDSQQSISIDTSRSQQTAALDVPEPNRLLAQLHAERQARLARQSGDAVSVPGPSSSAAAVSQELEIAQASFTLLTYNVWFAEEVALAERVRAIGNCIEQSGYPAFVCLQEMTENIYRLMSNSSWWRRYNASGPSDSCPYFTTLLCHKQHVKCKKPIVEVPFANSQMGRGLRSVRASVCGRDLIVATSHLESPTGRSSLFSQPRVEQCKQSLSVLDATNTDNVVFAGDMNWNSADGPVPLPNNWIDSWSELHPNDPGYTYDGRANPMLGPYNTLQGRLDRVFCKLKDFKLESISMVGRDAIPGVTYTKTYRGAAKKLPVLPSDHFGLVSHFSVIR